MPLEIHVFLLYSFYIKMPHERVIVKSWKNYVEGRKYTLFLTHWTCGY